MKISLTKILIFSVLIALLFVLDTCKLSRYVYYNFANITDYKVFPERTLNAPDSAFRFIIPSQGRCPDTVGENDESIDLDELLQGSKTVAFLMIRNDTLYCEKYLRNYTESSIVASFSMAKSVISMLIGCAIDDHLIGSVNEPVSKYLTDMNDTGFKHVTIRQVLNMSSGLDFDENYVNPFADIANFYYGTNLRKATRELKLVPGTENEFEYLSGNSQILGAVLDKALNGKTITSYFQEKIWTPLGMEYDGSWSIDRKKNGIEKTFCCINARARDFAKLGRLYLNKGNWNGKQIISEKWVIESTLGNPSAGGYRGYRFQWWLPNPGEDFMAQGILGQYIYVHKPSNTIIVRLGEQSGNVDWFSTLRSLALKL